MQLDLPLTSRALVIAKPPDRLFVLDLQRKFTNEVGFLPGQAIDWYIEHGRITLAFENSEPAGYLLGREAYRWNIACRPITQAAICFDAQRRHHGFALVASVAAAAGQAGQMAIQACCREGLAANAFWKDAGFEEICRLDPRSSRDRAVICWRLQLTTHRPAWFEVPPPISGYRATRTRTHKHTGA